MEARSAAGYLSSKNDVRGIEVLEVALAISALFTHQSSEFSLSSVFNTKHYRTRISHCGRTDIIIINMANNTDAPPQPPSRPGYRDTEQAQLIYLLRLRVPMTLKQHIFLVAMQIKARVYEEELKMFDGPFRESFCFLAVEVVLWHYRRNPRDFPRRFEPMHDLGEFCKILSENFLPYQREFRPYQREFHFPFAQPCGVFRGGTGESARDRKLSECDR